MTFIKVLPRTFKLFVFRTQLWFFLFFFFFFTLEMPQPGVGCMKLSMLFRLHMMRWFLGNRRP